jgi:hypothetical protein
MPKAAAVSLTIGQAHQRFELCLVDKGNLHGHGQRLGFEAAVRLLAAARLA